MKIVAVLALCVMGATATPAWACHVDPFDSKYGSDTSTNVAMRSAESCRIGFRTGRRSHMDSVALVGAPQHGTLTPVDETHWLYRPARGFTGTDQVTARTAGTFMGNRGTRQGESNITWMINVSP